MNEELRLLFEDDKTDHANVPKNTTPEYKALRERDRQRRIRAGLIIDAGGANDPEDYFHAAKLFQHGDAPEDAWKAHTLATQAAALGYRPARWLAAAALDRWLMYQGKPQKYGTQYVWDGYRDRLWDVEPATTDDERAVWDVPPLAEQIQKAVDASRNRPPVPVPDEAPQWLKDALKRWGVA
jgi:hypothetical protein